MKTKKRTRLLAIAAMLTCIIPTADAQSIEELWAAAEQNYPLIRQYELIRLTKDATLENIQRGWLPQISASAQATLQSDVAAWPSEMKGMLNQMGLDIKGLRRDQYRVGIDIVQPIYDGGMIRSQAELARAEADASEAEADVQIYQLRRRINDLYFGLLMIEEQMRLNDEQHSLLEANEKKLASMFKNGTAAECDWGAVRAEMLTCEQRGKDLEMQRSTLAHLLGVFCGLEDVKAELPKDTYIYNNVSSEDMHPELRLVDARLKVVEMHEHQLDVALRPRLSLFASGFYGYPGYNMFEDMMHHRWTLNGIVGAKLSWNITPLYTRRSDKARLRLQREQAEVGRDVFLFNQRLQTEQQSADIERLNANLAKDDEIISLRKSIRIAAESKLQHGIIDASGLVKEISNENSARLNKAVHQVQYWKTIYDKKVTINK